MWSFQEDSVASAFLISLRLPSPLSVVWCQSAVDIRTQRRGANLVGSRELTSAVSTPVRWSRHLRPGRSQDSKKEPRDSSPIVRSCGEERRCSYLSKYNRGGGDRFPLWSGSTRIRPCRWWSTGGRWSAGRPSSQNCPSILPGGSSQNCCELHSPK